MRNAVRVKQTNSISSSNKKDKYEHAIINKSIIIY